MIDSVADLNEAIGTAIDDDKIPVVVVDKLGEDHEVESVYFSATTEALVIQII